MQENQMTPLPEDVRKMFELLLERLERLEKKVENLKEYVADTRRDLTGKCVVMGQKIHRQIEEKSVGLDRKIEEKVSAIDWGVEGKISAVDWKIDEKAAAIQWKIEEKATILEQKIDKLIEESST